MTFLAAFMHGFTMWQVWIAGIVLATIVQLVRGRLWNASRHA